MAELLVLLFIVGAVASARARRDAEVRRGTANAVVRQQRTIIVLAVLAALLLISMTL